MGLPETDWHRILGWTDMPMPLRWPPTTCSPVRRCDIRRRLGREYHDYRAELIADRRQAPGGDDLASILVDATIDDQPLDDQQLHGYLSLLIGAGNETTRNAITGGVKALLEHPSERERLAADPDGIVETAVEELLRWTSPVIQFARTATDDFDPAGTRIKAGDTVVLWYPSANRDERQFPGALSPRRRPHAELPLGVRLRPALLSRREPRPVGAPCGVPGAGTTPPSSRVGRRADAVGRLARGRHRVDAGAVGRLEQVSQ